MGETERKILVNVEVVLVSGHTETSVRLGKP